METTGFRWGAEAPEYLQGKTAAETLDIINTLVQGVQELSYGQQEPRTGMHQYDIPAQNVSQDMSQSGLPDPGLAITNPQEYQEQLVKAIRQQQQNDLMQAAQPVFAQTADSARMLSSMDEKWKPIWHEYGKEIDNEVRNIPMQQRTKQLYDRAAELVMARHSDDIIERKAKERAQQMLEQGVGTAAPSYGGYEPSADEADQWAKFERSEVGKKLLDRVGKRKILDFCKNDNMTLEQYADMVAGSKARFDPDNPGRWETPDLAPYEGGQNG